MRYVPLLLFLALVLPSCKKQAQNNHQETGKLLRMADSLYSVENYAEGKKILAKLRGTLNVPNSDLGQYYCFVSQWSYLPKNKMLYADSALALLKTLKLQSQYPDIYYKAWLVKGDACICYKQYNLALRCYFNAKNISKTGNCDGGYLSNKLAQIYYTQRNYVLAAKYWGNGAGLLLRCGNTSSAQKQFYVTQGALNNAGVSFEKAGLLDSALKYYFEDVKVINRARQNHINVTLASIVVYDNLGSVYLKRGNLSLSQKYLSMATALPIPEIDGIKIPPYIKLAQLYMQTHESSKALAALKESRRMLNHFYKEDPELLILWNKCYAQFLYQQGDAKQAYVYQGNYIRLKDSLEKSSEPIFKLDVNRELTSIGQQQTLSDLANRNKLTRLYTAGILVVAAMLAIIAFLIYGNLKKSKKAQLYALAQNQQLQQTLAELERANQNYIRIMRVMAHDLRNPLSGMTGLAAMLLGEDEFSEDSKHMLHLIETTGIHSMEMINELLKSGLSDENEVIEVKLLDLKSLLFDSVELLQFKAKEKQQHILFESDDTPIMAYANHEKIWRVFNNLIVNAIKFSHEGGVIQAGISCDDKVVLISVSDNGIGIADKNKEAVFEMFTPAKRVGTGGEQPFGLGLSISKRIIEKHKGKIWFKSTPQIGTTFYIELPYAGAVNTI